MKNVCINKITHVLIPIYAIVCKTKTFSKRWRNLKKINNYAFIFLATSPMPLTQFLQTAHQRDHKNVPNTDRLYLMKLPDSDTGNLRLAQ